MAEGPGAAYVRDIAFGFDANLRGHWLDRLPAIDADIADMEAALARTVPALAGAPRPPGVIAAVREAMLRPERLRGGIEHRPPGSFRRGQPVEIEARLVPASGGSDGDAGAGGTRAASVTLRYRRVNQAETWRAEEMRADGERLRASIPADCSDSPFPLQYFFALRDAADRAWLFPGLGEELAGQPFFLNPAAWLVAD